ncbi:MAG: hypothetical protein M3O50_22680 [Myxococcota bacterium]|nr:hypothetical protein [Myxococcota bacterium]
MNNNRSRAHSWAVILLAGWPLASACSSDGTSPPSGATSDATTGNGTSGNATSGSASGNGTGSSAATSGAGGAGSGVAASGATSGGTSSGSLGGSGSSGVGGSSGSTSGSSPDASSEMDASTDATDSAKAGSSGNADGGMVDTTKPITVWLAGDSTMQPCSANACGTTPLCGWGSQFQPYFKSTVTVVDSAAGGRSIQTWLYEPNVGATLVNGECPVNPKTPSARWQAMLDPVNGMKRGDYLLVEFGINDTSATCVKHVGTALFQTYLGMMAQAAQKVGANPIFLTSTNAIICGAGSTVPPNRAFGPETKAAGMANGVPVIDLTTLTAAFYTTKGFCPNAGDVATTYTATTPIGLFFCQDHTHFEMAGASEIAGVVAKALRDQGIGLAAYLK